MIWFVDSFVTECSGSLECDSEVSESGVLVGSGNCVVVVSACDINPGNALPLGCALCVCVINSGILFVLCLVVVAVVNHSVTIE